MYETLLQLGMATDPGATLKTGFHGVGFEVNKTLWSFYESGSGSPYGLSYTTFEWSNFNVSWSGDKCTVTVDVTNSGNVAGKDVVEVYIQSPYTDYDRQNLVEKSAAHDAHDAINNILSARGYTTREFPAVTAVMSFFNRMGYTWTGGCYPLLTNGLREEWGFTSDGASELLRGTVTWCLFYREFYLPSHLEISFLPSTVPRYVSPFTIQTPENRSSSHT